MDKVNRLCVFKPLKLRPNDMFLSINAHPNCFLPSALFNAVCSPHLHSFISPPHNFLTQLLNNSLRQSSINIPTHNPRSNPPYPKNPPSLPNPRRFTNHLTRNPVNNIGYLPPNQTILRKHLKIHTNTLLVNERRLPLFSPGFPHPEPI